MMVFARSMWFLGLIYFLGLGLVFGLNFGKSLKVPFRVNDVLPALPRQISWPVLNNLHSAVDLLLSFVGSVSPTNGSIEWKGACFFDNEARLEFTGGDRGLGSGVLHLKQLVEKTTQLNSEKMQKETEVQKLMEENVRLTALLDKKEAQLLAMNEQCKLLMWQEMNAMQANMGLEFQRNKERFVFLKWGSNVFHNMLIIPPGSGIVHQVWHLASDSGNFQVNLEYLGWVIFYTNGILYPDSVVRIDSHTNMIAGLGVVGWGVGGIESEATMLRAKENAASASSKPAAGAGDSNCNQK
ncbi:unnamed protein product [Camellia sinensis]